MVRYFSRAAQPQSRDLCLVHGPALASGSHRSMTAPEFRPAANGWWAPRSSLPEHLLRAGPGEFLGEVDLEGESLALWAVETAAPEGETWTPLRRLLAEADPVQIKSAVRAAELAAWRVSHRHCGACGTLTVRRPDQVVFDCPACGMEFWPRLTPAVIMLVHRDDEVLLVRHSRYSMPIFSCVAGFVEAGETLEEAVTREIAEEVGVTIGPPSYFASQAWPFPHALMTAFFAPWTAGVPRPDGHEIVEAHWYRKDNLPPMPPALSIARQLVRAHFGDDSL